MSPGSTSRGNGRAGPKDGQAIPHLRSLRRPSERDFTGRQFDCVISAAALQPHAGGPAVPRMVELLRAGGRLSHPRSSRGQRSRRAALSNFALRAGRRRASVADRAVTEGPRALRDAWARHCPARKYLKQHEGRRSPPVTSPARGCSTTGFGATPVWDKPRPECGPPCVRASLRRGAKPMNERKINYVSRALLLARSSVVCHFLEESAGIRRMVQRACLRGITRSSSGG